MAQGAANTSWFLALPIAALHGMGQLKLVREAVERHRHAAFGIGALLAPRQWCNDNSGTPTMRPSQWKLKLSFKVAASSIRLISMMAALEGSGRRASTSTYSTRRSGNQSSLHLVPSANLNPLSELSVNTALTEGCAFASTGFAQGVPSEPALNLGACSATPEVASRHLLPHLGLVGRPRRPQPRVRPDAGA